MTWLDHSTIKYSQAREFQILPQTITTSTEHKNNLIDLTTDTSLSAKKVLNAFNYFVYCFNNTDSKLFFLEKKRKTSYVCAECTKLNEQVEDLKIKIISLQGELLFA